MLVYHGSSHNFKTLRIRKDLTRQSTLTNEGYGIYFSLDKSVACSYGRYLYIIEINDKVIVDMRKYQTCAAYVRKIRNELSKAFGLRLERYVDLRQLAYSIQDGRVAVIDLSREVELLLDSNEYFYQEWGSKVESIFNWLRKWQGVPRAYMFKYHIRECGIIRDVSPDVAVIINKERLS